MKLTMHIRMCSDWHVGTGTGRHGGIDRLIARDADGLPYVPASTIRNVWRDAAEMLARGLDGQDGGAWARLVRRLFGSQPSSTERQAEEAPMPSLLTMGDAVIGPALRAWLQPRARLQPGAGGTLWLRDALTYIKAGVAIDTNSGAAADDQLRFEEVAVGGLLLVADAEVELDAGITAADSETLYRFLCGAACLIERLGGKRRRGLGSCEVRLARDAEAPRALAELAQDAARHLEPAGVPKVAPQSQEATPSENGQPLGGDFPWRCFPITIELLSPLIAPDEIQGNVITSLDYIPGSMLLPVVVAAARRAGLRDVGERVARGDLRVLPATIEIAGARGLPVPLAWGKPKDALPEEADKIVSGILEKRTRKRQIKPIRRGYIAPAADDVVAFREKPATTLRTHNVINDERQTPVEEEGGVFSYEAIAAGQTFRSVVLLRGTTADANKLRDALTGGPKRLGRAKQVGYGRVSITAAAEEPAIENRRRHALNDFLVVWLETDALLLSSDLSAAATLEALADALAVTLHPDGSKTGSDLFVLAPEGHDEDTDSRSQVFQRTRRLQTWQAQWGLPRPSLTTVQAGSIAKLKLRDGVGITEEQWRTLEHEGIGERRAEGFGVVRVNDTLITTTPTMRKAERSPDDGTQSTPLPALSEAEKSFLAAIAERAWKRRIIACAEAVMSQREKRSEHLGFDADRDLPTMSQLGALRSRLPAEGAAGAAEVVGWIGRRQERRSGSRDDAGWLAKVAGIVSREPPHQDLIWGILELSTDDMPIPPDGSIDSMRQRLWAFAVTNTLLIAMRHHKRAGESSRETAPVVQGKAQ
jgi:CRISPR-associated protein Csx10